MAGIRVKEIMDAIEALAPKELAMDYDNVGLLVGSEFAKAEKVIVGLELTDSLLEEALSAGCDLIVVHHPLIFKPLKKVVREDVTGKRIMTLIKENISLYVAHTNLDSAAGGLNDYVAAKLKIDLDPVEKDEPPAYRLGSIEETTLIQLAKDVKTALNLNYLHYCGNDAAIMKKIGLCAGSGMSFYQDALKEDIDVYITGDVKYHDAVIANDLKVPIIDATHFGSEVIVGELLEDTLRKAFAGGVEIVLHRSYNNPIKTL